MLSGIYPWNAGVEYSDELILIIKPQSKPDLRARFRFPDALAYIQKHPGCKLDDVPRRDGDNGKIYSQSVVFLNLVYHGKIYMDENDRLYALEEACR